MKSKDLQKLVLSKYENGDGPSKIFNGINGVVGFCTINQWCKMIRETDLIQLTRPSGRPMISSNKGEHSKSQKPIKT